MTGRRVTGIALALASLTSLSCGTEVNQSLTIEQAQAPVATADSCMVPVGRSNTSLGQGTLDVDLDRNYGYTLFPLIRNNLLPLGTGTLVEQNNLLATGLSVKVVPPPGIALPSTPACPAEFDTRFSKLMPPGNEVTVAADVLRPCHSGLIRDLFNAGTLPADHAAEVVFTVVVRARAQHGESDIESGPFEFPIRVCMGCLQTGFDLTGFEGFDYPQTPRCDQLPANSFTGNPCGIAQDVGPVLCCSTDAMGQSIECPGRPRPLMP